MRTSCLTSPLYSAFTCIRNAACLPFGGCAGFTWKCVLAAEMMAVSLVLVLCLSMSSIAWWIVCQLVPLMPCGARTHVLYGFRCMLKMLHYAVGGEKRRGFGLLVRLLARHPCDQWACQGLRICWGALLVAFVVLPIGTLRPVLHCIRRVANWMYHGVLCSLVRWPSLLPPNCWCWAKNKIITSCPSHQRQPPMPCIALPCLVFFLRSDFDQF
jgi:hypothetical protein